jgi:hypothetical protein
MDIEKNVVKKTNKYVYFSDGTHMSHSDFHRYKQNIRNKLAIVHASEYKESIEVIVQLAKEKAERTKILEDLQEANMELHYAIDQQTPYDWEKAFREETATHNETKNKLVAHARNLYSRLPDLPILVDFQNDKGIKFIIQETYAMDEPSYRFCFDPYQLGANYHSVLSMEFFPKEDWGIINGGWMKVIGNTVTLYGESGDYGKYDDTIAITACKQIFPRHNIISFAGKKWNEV